MHIIILENNSYANCNTLNNIYVYILKDKQQLIESIEIPVLGFVKSKECWTIVLLTILWNTLPDAIINLQVYPDIFLHSISECLSLCLRFWNCEVQNLKSLPTAEWYNGHIN